MSSEPAKAVSAPPTYRNPPLGTVIEANVCKSTQLVMQGEEEGCRYSMWWCIYGELACATAVEAKPTHLPCKQLHLGEWLIMTEGKQYLARDPIGLAAKTKPGDSGELAIKQRAHIFMYAHCAQNTLSPVAWVFGKWSKCWVIWDRVMKELISQLPHSLRLASVKQSGRYVSHNPTSRAFLRSWCATTHNIHS